MKYTHYITFVTDKTGERKQCTGILSNNKMLTRKELLKGMDELMEPQGITMYNFGIIGTSTFQNK